MITPDFNDRVPPRAHDGILFPLVVRWPALAVAVRDDVVGLRLPALRNQPADDNVPPFSAFLRLSVASIGVRQSF